MKKGNPDPSALSSVTEAVNNRSVCQKKQSVGHLRELRIASAYSPGYKELSFIMKHTGKTGEPLIEVIRVSESR